MDKEKIFEFYKECMNMNLGKMLELITSTASEDEKNFYTELYNFVLRKYFMNSISFNQETTLCGKSIIKNIETAK